jgi:hypothetical protein
MLVHMVLFLILMHVYMYINLGCVRHVTGQYETDSHL